MPRARRELLVPQYYNGQLVTGVIRNWVKNEHNNRPLIEGQLIHDFRERFEDFSHIYTSYVTEFAEDGKYAITLNSIYELDPPYKNE